MQRMNSLAKFLFPFTALLLLILPHFDPQIARMSAGFAVMSGIGLSFFFGNPYLAATQKISATLLPWSIVGLGFGMNLITVARVGLSGFVYTIFGILLTVLFGLLLGTWLKNQRNISVLITMGTAICGGSAIAAISPAIHAKHHETSVALAIVFLLNAVALFVFPPIGHALHLSQSQFGLWSALAIHDTSSVVGATLQYGTEALDIGTTTKLARALWIVPMTLIVAVVYAKFYHTKNTTNPVEKIKKPWFILWFVVAAALVTWIPALKTPGIYIRNIAEQGLILTLFCIGANLSRAAFKTAGVTPFLQGLCLWVVMASVTLSAIYFNF